MTTTPSESVQSLRRRAEELFRTSEYLNPELTSPEETKLLFNELRVHQIQLEMQNEELCRVHEELDASQSRYFNLYDLAPVGYLTIGANGLIKEANLASAAMLGVVRINLIRKIFSEFVSPEDKANFYLIKKRVVETGEMQNREMLLKRGDGVLFWANLQASRVHTGEYGITITDTTKLKQAEQELRAVSALRESEERFRNIANAAPVLIWISGTDKLCHWFNRVWLDFTGRTMEQETGNGWAEGVHPDDLERCLKTYVKAFDNRQPFSIAYRLRAANGQYRWLMNNGVPTYVEHAFTGYIGSCVDILPSANRRKRRYNCQKLRPNPPILPRVNSCRT